MCNLTTLGLSGNTGIDRFSYSITVIAYYGLWLRRIAGLGFERRHTYQSGILSMQMLHLRRIAGLLPKHRRDCLEGFSFTAYRRGESCQRLIKLISGKRVTRHHGVFWSTYSLLFYLPFLSLLVKQAISRSMSLL